MSYEHTRAWGPVSEGEAASAGSIQGAASVVIIPNIPSDVVQAALQCLPSEVLPCADDTPETLAARLGASSFLDDAHVLNKGNGKRGRNGQKRCRLNETRHRAPRRKSWSVEVDSAREDEDGERVVQCFNYSAYGRLAEDVRSQPMPYPVFTLGEQLWLAAMPYLCEASRRNPPTLIVSCCSTMCSSTAAWGGTEITTLCAISERCSTGRQLQAQHPRAWRTLSALVLRYSFTQKAARPWTSL